MLICYPHFRRKGYLLPFYMIGYGTIRLFVEGLRSDSFYLLPCITGAVRLPDYSRYRYTFYHP